MREMLRRYEGLIILNVAEKDEEIQAAIDKVQKEIEALGGRVEKVQRMDARPFARGRGNDAVGYYVNYAFSAPPAAIAQLDEKFNLDPTLYRWQFTLFVEVKKKEKKPNRKLVTKVEGAPARE